MALRKTPFQMATDKPVERKTGMVLSGDTWFIELKEFGFRHILCGGKISELNTDGMSGRLGFVVLMECDSEAASRMRHVLINDYPDLELGIIDWTPSEGIGQVKAITMVIPDNSSESDIEHQLKKAFQRIFENWTWLATSHYIYIQRRYDRPWS